MSIKEYVNLRSDREYDFEYNKMRKKKKKFDQPWLVYQGFITNSKKICDQPQLLTSYDKLRMRLGRIQI